MAFPTATAFLILSSIIAAMGEEEVTPTPTVSPKREFIASPRNVTVLEGHTAVLRCKMSDTVHNCQWFYLETGLDVFDSKSEPLLVTEFRPKKNKDCSIKFKQTKLIQAGQWICKGLQIHARKYVVSRPAILRVLEAKGGEQDKEILTTTEEEDVGTDVTFQIEDEGHIINTNLGDSAILGCQTNKELQSCSWIRPDGTTLKFKKDKGGNYEHEGNYTDGNCSLRINAVSAKDEGNWRCVVSTSGKGDKLGPLIHLHVLEFGLHAEDFQGRTGSQRNDSSLVIILVTTSIVLLVVIISLVVYMYKNVWRNKMLSHKYLESNHGTNSEYSHYGSTWLPGMPSKDLKLIENSSEIHSSGDYNTNPNSRYLDMSGSRKGEGYVTFPESSMRSSMSSGTTLSTIQVGQNPLVDSDNSARTSTSDSLHSVSTFGNSPGERANPMQGRELPKRSDSVYSSGHLYEEIDETKMRRKQAGDEQLPDYANIEEDMEGYMIPKSRSQEGIFSESQENADIMPGNQRAPPYSKLGETGLIPDSDPSNFATNPTYSTQEPVNEPEESYDAPHDPPVPVRDDSADNPLAAYDVPKHTPNEAFVITV